MTITANTDELRLAINAEIGESAADIYDYLRLASHKNAGALVEIFGGDARCESDVERARTAASAAMQELYPQCQFTIGYVVFVRDNPGPEQKRDACLIGEPRIEALRAAFRREPIPDGLRLFVYGFGYITPEQVLWDTAGERVTK